MKNQKILIVSPRAFGYVEYLYSALKKHKDVQVSIIYIEFPGYKNWFEKIQNFLSKTFLGKNRKGNYSWVLKELDNLDHQNKTLIIRPDILLNETLEAIKKNTNEFIAYYWDSIQRLERKKDIIHYFDKIYSFDKIDVAKYNFEFTTNYIFTESEINKEPDYLFFNISGNDDDYRFKQLESFGKYLNTYGWTFKFISIHRKLENVNQGIIDVVDKVIEVQEVIGLIKNAKILVEFQRKNQIGLSFRVFEALGLQKKLITNNKDIVNYDFYNPQNILVIDENNPTVSESFVNSAYIPIDDAILEKYKIDAWLMKVLNV